MIRCSSSTSRGTSYWFLCFVAIVVLLSGHAQVFRTNTTNLDPRALLFRAWLRERWALGNPETGVFFIGFREEQRTRTWLAHSFSRENTVLGSRKFINQFPLFQHPCSYIYKKIQEDVSRTFGLQEKHWVFCPKGPSLLGILFASARLPPFLKQKCHCYCYNFM